MVGAPQFRFDAMRESPAQFYPVPARIKRGDGRLSDARYAADSPAGVAGARGGFGSFSPEADTPALLRGGLLGALGGNWISAAAFRRSERWVRMPRPRWVEWAITY